MKCHNCGREIVKPSSSFVLRVELLASPAPIELTADDLLTDPRQELEELIEEMETLDTQEATDEVYEAYSFELCRACRDRIHALLQSRVRRHKVQ
jgi:hypothetical protein